MKRKLTLLLAMTLLLTLLPGCQTQKELPTTTIFNDSGMVELPLVTMLLDPGLGIEASNYRRFLETVPGNDRDFHVEIEMLPTDADGQQVREQQLQRIRTEIMAGKGPDIFICDNYNNVTIDVRPLGGSMAAGALFSFPTRAMENHLFLPLDDYIENAQFMEFDQLEPLVMAAGRNEEGQQILPMAFDLWLSCYTPSLYGMPQERPGSRQEMLDSGCPILEMTAKGIWGVTLLDCFPKVIDWEQELPAFSEDELLERTLGYWDSSQKRLSGEYVLSNVDKREGALPLSSWMLEWRPGEDSVLVPDYNYDDGVTAFVTTFAAINRNASYPDYAFTILDKLLSKDEQNMSRIYMFSISGMPVYTGAAGGKAALTGQNMSPELETEYKELLGLVDNVRFLTLLDNEMIRTVTPVCEEEGSTPEDVEKAVHQAYTAMKMMLAES